MSFRALLAQLTLAVLIFEAGGCSRARAGDEGGPTHGDPKVALAGLASGEERRPLRSEETTPEIEQRAKEILDAKQDAPIGTEVPFEIGGRSYVAQIEEHYHEPGGPRRPWGTHRGVTVYHAE
jgi:hypothetical protein